MPVGLFKDPWPFKMSQKQLDWLKNEGDNVLTISPSFMG
jgi:hypothetical protein